MSRLFTASGSNIMTYTTASTAWAFGTVLIVCKFAGADSTWQSLVEITDVSNNARMSLGRRVGGQIYLANSNGLESAGSAVAASGWQIIAVTKATGTVAPTAHVLPIGGSRTSTTFGNTLANGAGSGVRIHIGGPGDFADIYVAAAAVWNGVVLTTTQLDGILSAKTTASILALNPTWATDDSDFSQDLTASNWDRSAITGTASDADNPSGWVYGAGGGDATVTAVPATTLADAPAATISAGSNVTGVVGDTTAAAPIGAATAQYGTDNFETRPNGTLGAPWVAFNSLALPTVSSGEVYSNTDTTPTDVAANPVVIGPDTQVELTFGSALSANRNIDLYARISTLSGIPDYYAFRMTGTLWRIIKCSAGVGEAISNQVSRSQTLSTIEGMRLTCVGNVITGYVRVSGVWSSAITFTDSTSPITSAGYPGFGTARSVGGASGGGIEDVTWAAAGSVDATVTAVPAATATSAPAAAISAGATVSAVPGTTLTSAPPANQIISSVVNAPAVVVTTSAPAAAVSSNAGDATVAGVPAATAVDAPAGSLSAGQIVTGVVADTATSAPAGALSGGASVTAVPGATTTGAPRAAISPAPASSGVSGDVAATFAEAST